MDYSNTYYSGAFPRTFQELELHTGCGPSVCKTCLSSSLPSSEDDTRYIFFAYCQTCAKQYNMSRGCIDEIPSHYLKRSYDEELNNWLKRYYAAIAPTCSECKAPITKTDKHCALLCKDCLNPDHDPHWPPIGS